MRYFFGAVPSDTNSALEINKVIYGDYFAQRENNACTEIIVMLPAGTTVIPAILNTFVELTESAAQAKVQEEGWKKTIP